MKIGVRGIEATLDCKRRFQPYQLLEDIALENYQMYLPWCLTSNIMDTFTPRIITHSELKKLSEKNSIWEIILHIIPLEMPLQRIDDYEDFLKSRCQCSIMYYDCANLDVYVKQWEWLEIIKNNVQKMCPKTIRIKTDANDTRKRFL